MKKITTLIIAALTIAAVQVQGEHSFPDGVPIPAEAREYWLDVTDFGARPDDGRDDTEAFRKAFAQALKMQYELAGTEPNRWHDTAVTVFVPAGVYTISGTLAYSKDADDGGLNLVGEDRARTILRLNDKAEGFDDPANPRSIIQFWTGEENQNVPGGGMAFHNYVRNLTIESGSDNPGVVGVDFYNHNLGGLRNVTIRSGDGSGVAGLAFDGFRSGVGLHSNVRIEGFEVGVSAVGRDFNGYTLRDIELINQTRAAIELRSTMWITFHRLRYEGPAPLLRMNKRNSTLNLIEVQAHLTGNQPVEPFDYRNGTLYLQDVKLTGYNLDALPLQSYKLEGDTIVYGLNADTLGAALPDFEHLNAHHLFEAEPWLMKPPAPIDYPQWPQAEDDVRVIKPSESPSQTRRDIQDAIDSGATDLFFQRAYYEIDGPIYIRGNIRRLHGGFGRLRPRPPLAQSESLDDAAFIIEDRPETVIFEAFGKIGGGVAPNFLNRSSGTLILRDIFFSNARDLQYHNTGQGGTVVFENVKTRHSQRLTGLADLPAFVFRNGHTVLGWNFNPEQQQALSLINDGAFMWVAGGKFGEREGPIMITRNGGVSMLHGIWLNVGHRPALDALLIFEDAYGYVTASFNRNGFPANPHYVREVRGGVERILETLHVAGSGWGAALPYYFTPAPEGLDGFFLPEVADFPRFVPERIRGVSEPPEPQAAAAAQEQAAFLLDRDQPLLVWDFEDRRAADPLAGWRRLSRTLVIRETEDSNRYLEMERGSVTTEVELAPEVRRIRASVRIRATGLDPEETRRFRQPLLAITFRNSGGDRVGGAFNWLALEQDADWTLLTEEFAVPPGAVRFDLQLRKAPPEGDRPDAVIGFDDIIIEAIEVEGE